MSQSDRWGMDINSTIKIVATLESGAVLRLVNVTDSQHSSDPIGVEEQLFNLLGPVAKFRLPVGTTESKCIGYKTTDDSDLPLGTNGERTAAFVDYLLRTDRPRFEGFVKNLCSLIPNLRDIQVGTPDARFRQLRFSTSTGMTFTDSSVSDGVRLCTFFVALAWHPRPPRTILIEEPENGIHPARLRHVMDLLHGLSEGRFSKQKCQVILTTHSPYLLDLVDPQNDQVLVFQRNSPDGTLSARPIDSEKIKAFLDDDFRLGEIWTNETEDGLI
jgi:hypothetical protein